MSQMYKVSLSELAERAGVSAATVSRVLNNRRGINAATRQRVLEAARISGYRPRVASRPTTVALIIDRPSESRTTGGGFIETLTMYVLEALAHHQLVVETFTSGNLTALPRRFLDGVLAIAWRDETLDIIRRLENVPVAIFNRPEYPSFGNIQIDNEQTGRLAAEHLLAQGHKRVGFMGEQMDSETAQRLTGFRQVVENAGLELPEAAVGMTCFIPPYSTLQRLHRSGVTGLFVSCEHLTAEIPYMCAEAVGLKVPQQLSIIGTGVEAAMKFHRPPMTLVAPPVQEMADTAVGLLSEMIASTPGEAQTITLQPKLVIRDSVTPPAAA